VAEGTSKRDQGGARANTPASAWLAWSLAGLTLAMFVATIRCGSSLEAPTFPAAGGPMSASEVWWEEPSFWPSRWSVP
jgi:hypothetical protein